MRGLTSWLAGVLGLVVLAASPSAAAPAPMPTLSVGGLKLSKLILGTDHLGKVPNAQTLAVLNEAVRLGINAFDTSPIYAQDIELRLAAWLKKQHRRDLYVISKGGFPRDLGPGTYDSRLKGTRAAITSNVLAEVLNSRKRYDRPIDIYLMHRDDVDYLHYVRVQRPQTPASTILEALSDPVLKANYGMIGLSNWTTPRVEEAQRAARQNPDLLPPVCNSPYFSLFEMGPTTIHSGGVQVTHAEMMRRDFQPGIRLMTYSPLGGFSIARPGWPAAEDRARKLMKAHDRYWGHVHDALFYPANARRYDRAVAFTKAANARWHTAYTLDQVLDAYVLAHPRTDFVVVGPRTVADLDRTVEALQVARRLTAADLDTLYGPQ